MSTFSESESNCGYNSDIIDSDIEVSLYGAIHHSFGSDVNNITDDSQQLNQTSEAMDSKTKDRKELDVNSSDKQIDNNINKPLNNLFRLLDHKIDHKIDESDDEFNNDFVFNDRFLNRNKQNIECIQIDDSSDESDIVIINDKSFDTKTKHKNDLRVKSTKIISNSLNISLGNVNNLKETTLSVMDKFYNEDIHDSEEEEKSFNEMSGDKRLWKISYNDLLLGRKESNRYYRNKFICNNCNERGHQARDCPQPKKSPVCYLCGLSGHRSDRCKSQLCSKCMSCAHKTINCNVLLNRLVCGECGVGGHEANQCTYNWRKYHLTTNSCHSEPIFSNLLANERKSCYNCGAIGKHFGHECRSKSMTKHMIPVSPLMLNPRKSHCFNGRESNNRRNDCNQKALCNEFVKSISSNELSCLSASFNKPLDDFDLIQTSATTTPTIAQTFNNQNKHIKWIYPESNGTQTSSHSSGRLTRNCQNSETIGVGSERTVFHYCSPLLYANTNACDLNSAHTLTPGLQLINNGMQEKSQTQTTPQPMERSKRRNRRKKRKIIEKESELKLIRESNITQNQTNTALNSTSNGKRKKRIKYFMNRKVAKFQ